MMDETGWRPLPEGDPLRETWPRLRVLAEMGMLAAGPIEHNRHVVSDVWREVERLRAVEARARDWIHAEATDEQTRIAQQILGEDA